MLETNRINEALLDVCVKRSLGYDPIEAEKWSIVSCAKNEYLDPEYDPFKMLEFTLMAYTMRQKYGISTDIE